MRGKFDIVIAGAGPVGLALASFLADAGLRIAVVEKQARKSLERPSYDGREIALTLPSWQIMQDAGMITRVEEKAASHLRAAAVVNGDSPYRLAFDAEEAGREFFGRMMSNQLIRAAAWRTASAKKNVTVFDGVEVTGLEGGADCRRAVCDDGRVFDVPLVVAADSRFSRLRGLAGIEVRKKDFNRLCIVTRVGHDKSLEETAFECFGYERTMALLPLKNGACSVVLTVPPDEGKRLMGLSDNDFVAEIAAQAKPFAGKIRAMSERFSYPLVGVFAESFYARRVALAGDAAVGMHPVTAHGFNLGLSGARILADEIVAALQLGGDIGGGNVLRAYHDRHLRQTLPLYEATNLLVGLYGRTDPLSRAARQAMLLLGNHVHPARKHIIDGLAG